ncbi:MAG: GtrA family protein [Methanobacterium sp.]|uniref:GtrA family protein n=1 Tax=Methanobacterium sp. TaxID=2164 RepID=UPI003D656D81|nr:GtrA family protein [Methanobacterium sp.]
MNDTKESTIDKLIKNQTDNTHIQFFRYIFVGGIAFIVDFGSLFILTQYFGIYYLFSAAIAFILGLIANYALSIKWVFNKRTLNNIWSEFTIFTVIGVIGLGLTVLFMWFFTEYITLYYLFSKIITASLVLFWNFSARKITLFR